MGGSSCARPTGSSGKCSRRASGRCACVLQSSFGVSFANAWPISHSRTQFCRRWFSARLSRHQNIIHVLLWRTYLLHLTSLPKGLDFKQKYKSLQCAPVRWTCKRCRWPTRPIRVFAHSPGEGGAWRTSALVRVRTVTWIPCQKVHSYIAFSRTCLGLNSTIAGSARLQCIRLVNFSKQRSSEVQRRGFALLTDDRGTLTPALPNITEPCSVHPLHGHMGSPEDMGGTS